MVIKLNHGLKSFLTLITNSYIIMLWAILTCKSNFDSVENLLMCTYMTFLPFLCLRAVAIIQSLSQVNH